MAWHRSLYGRKDRKEAAGHHRSNDNRIAVVDGADVDTPAKKTATAKKYGLEFAYKNTFNRKQLTKFRQWYATERDCQQAYNFALTQTIGLTEPRPRWVSVTKVRR